MKKLNIILSIFLFFIVACSKEEKEISVIKETRQDLEMISAYKEAYQALNEGDPYFAAKKFLEAELLFPQSDWAPKSALMASYSYYMQNFYSEALHNLNRFLKTYPTDKNIAYANYLIAMCYYETIEDEKRDSAPLLKAKDQFNFIVQNYPNTEFALDAKFKLGLIEESQKYANVLGYNYLSSEWYKKSYKVFNQDYSSQIQKPIKDKTSVLEKFKKLFD